MIKNNIFVNNVDEMLSNKTFTKQNGVQCKIFSPYNYIPQNRLPFSYMGKFHETVQEIEKNVDKHQEDKFSIVINNSIGKIDNAINNFRFNVAIALFYEMYNFFKGNLSLDISNKVLNNSLIKFMKLMIPFTPHLAYECLEVFNCKDIDKWPNITKNLLDEIKFAIQINGKTRDIITIKKDAKEKEVDQIIKKNEKIQKYFVDQKISKTIFVKNKIINYIIQK